MSPRPKRFCMITTFYPPYNFGGDGIFVQRLSNELARRGHHVEIIHCVDSYRLLGGQATHRSYELHPNVTVHGLHSRLGFLSPLATQQTGVPLLNAARIHSILSKGFDVVHYHNVSLVGGPAVLKYGEGIKLYTTHEFWLVCPTHVLFRFNRAPCSRRDCLACQLMCGRPPQWWRYSNLLRDAVQHVDAFLAPSRFCIAKHREFGVDLPFVHMPYFVPQLDNGAASRPEDSDAEPRRPYFLFLGRLEKLKGLHTLIPLFRQFRQAQLWIAGQGAWMTRLQRMAQGMPNVCFLGYQSGPQLRRLVAEAVAVIVPSICFDISPLVILEAFRQRTPVIARDLGGMTELVEDSGGGLVYRSDQELLAAMGSLIRNPKLRQRLADTGYQAYLHLWTPEAHLQRYLSLIDELAQRRKSGQPSGRADSSAAD